jgi:hypothetical protein
VLDDGTCRRQARLPFEAPVYLFLILLISIILQTLLQRIHNIDDVAGSFGLRLRFDRLLAFLLRFDQIEQLILNRIIHQIG